MSGKIEINVADINLLSLNDQGEFFVKHFDVSFNFLSENLRRNAH